MPRQDSGGRFPQTTFSESTMQAEKSKPKTSGAYHTDKRPRAYAKDNQQWKAIRSSQYRFRRIQPVSKPQPEKSARYQQFEAGLQETPFTAKESNSPQSPNERDMRRRRHPQVKFSEDLLNRTLETSEDLDHIESSRNLAALTSIYGASANQAKSVKAQHNVILLKPAPDRESRRHIFTTTVQTAP